jgi:hypothetical protein
MAIGEIVVFTSEEHGHGQAPAFRGIAPANAIVSRAIAAGEVVDNFSAFVSAISEALNRAPAESGGLRLDEIEVNAGIDGSGKIGFVGIADLGISVKTGIKLVFKRS